MLIMIWFAEEEDSWKSILTAKGYAVEIYMHGLGENKAFSRLYVEHIKDAIAGKWGISREYSLRLHY